MWSSFTQPRNEEKILDVIRLVLSFLRPLELWITIPLSFFLLIWVGQFLKAKSVIYIHI